MIKVRAISAKVAEILIMDVIGEDLWTGGGVTAQKIKEQLDALGDGVEQINVRISSPGGNVWDGVAIYNLLREHEAEVHMHVEALAASAASIIAMAGDKIVMHGGAMMMIHNPSSLAWGTAKDMRKTADTLDKVAGEMASIYKAHAGGTNKAWMAAMDEETWYTGAEAVSAGLADEAMSAEDDPAEMEPVDEQTAEAWTKMLSQFKRVPDSVKALAKTKPKRVAQITIHGVALDEMTPETRKAMAQMVAQALRDDPEPRIVPANAPTPAQEPTAMTPEEIQAANDKAAAEALAKDKARRDSIKALFKPFMVAALAAAVLTERQTLEAACLEDTNCGVDSARAKLLDVIAKQNAGTQPVAADASVSGGADARDKFKIGAERALLVRLGVEKREGGNEFYGRTLADLAEMALRLAGVSVSGLTKDGLARRVLATQTTSDFPQLLSNVAGKVLRAAYGAFAATWQSWALKGQVSDFKIHPRIQMGSFNNLQTVLEGGEYTAGSLGEDYENAQAATKGKLLRLTRQMIVNDDLGGFNRRAQLMGTAAARTVNTDAYTYMTSGAGNLGPNTSDGGQYFNATAEAAGTSGHANYTSSGTAISTASIAVGRRTMRLHRDKNYREVLNILPKVLLCSTLKEDLAWAVLNSVTDVSQSNPAKKNYAFDVAKLDLVTDPFMDGIGSGLPWYMFAAPSDAAAAFEVVFLDGNDTPFIDEAIDFWTDAMDFKIRLDYGVANGDWRGGYRNAGA